MGEETHVSIEKNLCGLIAFEIPVLQGGPKKVSQIIFAITLSTASQFP